MSTFDFPISGAASVQTQPQSRPIVGRQRQVRLCIRR